MKRLNIGIKTGFVLALLVFSLMIPFAHADETETPETEEQENESGTNNGLHKGHNKEKHLKAAFNGLNKERGTVHLYLYEKDPATWEIVHGGSWGKLTYLPHKDKFIFNGHGIESEIAYSLINYAPSTDWSEEPYPNPWPGDDSVEITSGVVNEEGNIHLKGTWSEAYVGKIWLVPSSDFAYGSGMIAWNPTEYMFEYDLIPALPA